MSDFWSRRKGAVEEAQEAERKSESEAREQAEQAERAAAQAEMTEAELLESLNLPNPDTAKSGDNIAAFMAKQVPQHIRNRALRSLWRSNPVLACVDGLNDYDGDFTGNGLKDGVLKTSYQVGKGLAAHVQKMAEDAETAEAKITDDREIVVPDEKDRETKIAAGDQNPLDEGKAKVNGMLRNTGAEETSGPVVKPSIRMRFTFEEDDRE
ncbi:Protein of unknown function [Jannaschia faecimaris]|uniref:DUF3306 domain-containing protein n=1 Tax=Jannaschia faecimaris TaxID=1244108 RepID=A0A1H3JN93_9RHOB|nr:DUF3306 domain-containing protein [Jannaschia faecimaris]SDY40734.1 Protein of unknown function [Jannaschia faecimaris]